MSKTHNGRPRQWSDDKLLKAVRRFKRQLKRVPTQADLGPSRPEGYPSAATLAYRFGSFANAIEQAGFDRPRRGRRPATSR